MNTDVSKAPKSRKGRDIEHEEYATILQDQDHTPLESIRSSRKRRFIYGSETIRLSARA